MSTASSNARRSPEGLVYRMMLFVAGDESNSALARANLDALCANYLANRCEVEIVDVLRDYRLALEHNILVTPCLLKLEPPPRALIAGTLHDTDAVLTALRLTSE